ncbi:transcriptional regulator [Streptomyces sp. PTM05]|uniref:Transcriptional regulator n=1 Tax=Streptantibioticus parmotrematis TaxID=2873249 RepID=A0ABS7QLV5_9ACTN|nr:transcriptional regulator [Streptantibioticus parmotrematis]MBY8884168.1 transcriptional regulator [Streptantibioticus parmotrematis]
MSSSNAVPPPPRPATRASADRGPLPECLVELLRTGPFCVALRAAIEARGLTLHRLKDRLAEAGCPITVATLSAWQRGQHRPERSHALKALATLERILRLPAGALTALLEPPKPRGRWLDRAAGRPGMAEVWLGSLDGALTGVDPRWGTQLTCLSRHQVLELDAGGREARIWNRHVLRAECNGPDRYVVAYRADTPNPAPVLRTRGSCRVGRVVDDPRKGILAAELVFAEPLSRGQTVIVEYTYTHTQSPPLSRWSCVNLQGPVRECVVEVRFHPAAIPRTCHTFHLPHGAPTPSERLLRVAADHSAHTIGLDLPPSRFGVHWEW